MTCLLRCKCWPSLAGALSLIALAAVASAEESSPAGDASLPDNHPLLPVLQLAEKALAEAAKVEDYTCLLVKRERIEGKLLPYHYMTAKIRHARTDGDHQVPFSVYLQFHRPAGVKGREVLYVDGQNAGLILAKRGGSRLRSLTTSLRPDSRLAMQENRYPITDIGLQNMMRKLVEIGREDLRYQECDVQYYDGAKVSGRVCTHIRVIHPQRREYFRFHRADIYVDDELHLPVRYTAFDWPPRPDESPRLLEEYNYLNLKLNVGLDDSDFDRDNPAYGFKKEDQEAAR